MFGIIYNRLLITLLATFRCSIDDIDFVSFLKCDTAFVMFYMFLWCFLVLVFMWAN